MSTTVRPARRTRVADAVQQRVQQLGHPLAVLKFLRHPLHLAMNCHQQAVHRLRIQDAVLVNRQFLDNPDAKRLLSA
jgi:hypothetical protein